MNNTTLLNEKKNILQSFLSKQNVVAFTVLCLGSLVVGLIIKHAGFTADSYVSFDKEAMVKAGYNRNSGDNQENYWKYRKQVVADLETGAADKKAKEFKKKNESNDYTAMKAPSIKKVINDLAAATSKVESLGVEVDKDFCPTANCLGELDKANIRKQEIKISAEIESALRLLNNSLKEMNEAISSTAAAASMKKGKLQSFLKKLKKKRAVLDGTWANNELKKSVDDAIEQVTLAVPSVDFYAGMKKKFENTPSYDIKYLNSSINAYTQDRKNEKIHVRFRRPKLIIEIEGLAKDVLVKLGVAAADAEEALKKHNTTIDGYDDAVSVISAGNRLALPEGRSDVKVIAEKYAAKELVTEIMAAKKGEAVAHGLEMQEKIISLLNLKSQRKAAEKALIDLGIYKSKEAGKVQKDIKTVIANAGDEDLPAFDIVSSVMLSKSKVQELDELAEKKIYKNLGICSSFACRPLEPEETDLEYVVKGNIFFSDYDDVFKKEGMDKLKEFGLTAKSPDKLDISTAVLADMGYEGDVVKNLVSQNSDAASEYDLIKFVLLQIKTAEAAGTAQQEGEEETQVPALVKLSEEENNQIKELIVEKKALKPFAYAKDSDQVQIVFNVDRVKITTDWIKTWLELSLAGVAMGFLLFLMASGMTLVFGLMGVFNLAHGAFIALGAYIGWKTITAIDAATVVTEIEMWSPMPGVVPAKAKETLVELGMFYSSGVASTVFALIIGLVVTAVVCGLCGYLFERVIVKPVYTNALKQILITMGGSIVIVELLLMFFHSEQAFAKPDFISGQLIFLDFWDGGMGVDKSRIFAGIVGIAVFIVTVLILNKTKIGLLIRAGVESREMVEVMGYRINLIFIMVFIAAIVFAGMGGVIYGLNIEGVGPEMANDLLIMVIVAIIIGGMGSVKGCLIGALLITLANNYMAAIWPPLSGEAGTVSLMVIILMWRPQGLNPITSH